MHRKTAYRWFREGRLPVRVGDERAPRTLMELLSDPIVTVIVVEHRDQLTTHGFEYFQASMTAAGLRVVVLNNAESANDLVGEVTGGPTLQCARRSGRRLAARRAARAVAVATGSET